MGSDSIWSAAVADEKQYLQIDFIDEANITGIKTKGREDIAQWVTAYFVEHSNDGITWHKIKKEDGSEANFAANYDPYSVVTNYFPATVRARYIRILPTNWKNWISMQIEIMGCYNPPPCRDPMGLDEGFVTIHQLSSSSKISDSHSASNGRLLSGSSWIPAKYDHDQFMQVDLLEPAKITGIITKGDPDVQQWVTSYYVGYSNDSVNWKKIQDINGKFKDFNGNNNHDSASINLFPIPVISRYIRLLPIKWHRWTSVRLELLGCSQQQACREPMGLENGLLSDGQITASTSYDWKTTPSHARINDKSGWQPDILDKNPYLQLDLIEPRNVSAIVTKGIESNNYWTSKYKVLFSKDGVSYLSTVDDYDDPVLFKGNTDRNSPVVNVFPDMVEARFFRIYPLEPRNKIGLRIELLGCYHPYVCQSPLGMESNEIFDFQVSASSYLNPSLSPLNSRFDSYTAWVPEDTDDTPFIQVDMLVPINMTGLMTRGRHDSNEWVKSYVVYFSDDGIFWNGLRDEYGENIEFQANYDSDSSVTTLFPTPIFSRYLRLKPMAYEGKVALRLEVLGCSYNKVCLEPMGLEDGLLSDGHITASSFKSELTKPSNARLNSRSSWEPASDDDYQYLQVDFGNIRNLSALVTKGSKTDEKWVTSYEIFHSMDGKKWEPIKNDAGQPINFMGNTDNESPVTNMFPETLEVQMIRVKPKDWKNGISMRVEILGCYHPYEALTPSTTKIPEIVKAWDIEPTILPFVPVCPNSMNETSLMDDAIIEASSSAPGGDVSRLPLNTHGDNKQSGGWVPKVEDRHPYLFIAFPEKRLMTSFYIKGREDEENWVTQLRIIGSVDNKTWLPVFGPNGEEVIEGNKNQVSLVGHYFSQATEAKYVKVIPESWHKWPSFRFDLFGCYEMETTTPILLEAVKLCPELTFDPELVVNCPTACPPGTLCDGQKCVDPVDCVCVRDGKIFKVSDKIEDEECRECFCALGGQSRCVEKKCPLCAENERSILNEECTCSCLECEPNKVICPTSHECIPKQRWCDGIVDCPDDETNCPSTPMETSTIPLVPIVLTTPTPPGNATCDVMGKHIKTFDGQDITYDICHHIIMTDIRNGTFNITLHKECGFTGDCKHWLEVKHKNHEVKVSSDLEVELNGHNYTAFLLSNLKKKPKAKNFFVEKIGDHVIIKSLVKGFTAIYDKKGHLKIEVIPSLKTRLGGLCGYYSEKPQDDQKKPDGKLAYTSREFGDSWMVEGDGKQCEPVICPHETMTKSLEQCNKLRDEPFGECGKVLIVDHFIEFCMSSMCECMMHKKDFEEKCKCDSFQPFVDACEEKLGPTAVRNWRFKHACHTECPPGMEWNDCGPSCQLTCDITSEESMEQCSDKCVSGCFCPPGTVLNEDNCIPPNTCTDKTCQGFGDPHLKTFDGLFYPFLAEGSFLIVGDTNREFSIKGFSRRCSIFSHATCLSGLQIKYKEDTVTIKKHKDIQLNNTTIAMDQLPLYSNGMVILGYPGRTFVVVVPKISLEARYYEDNSGFAVKVPSRRYFNKTEGLCGNCNGKKDDEISDKPLSEFVCNFQTEGDKDECKKSLDTLPEVKERNPLCEKLEDPVFDACHPLLDLEVYLDACSFDAVHSGKPKEAMCKTAMEYARQCCQIGISINDWPEKLDCDMKCPENLHYEQCHKGCPQTCISYKNSTDNALCQQLKTDGCFCPEGQVLNGDDCVDPVLCETCDEKGHARGDTWKDGECIMCVCNIDLKIECSKEICPEKPICSENEALVKIAHDNEDSTCCERYTCAPKKEDCPPPKIPDCTNGEVAKMHTGKLKCPELECECDPALCGDVVWPADLEIGQYVETSHELCCPKIKISCNYSLCPEKPKCESGTRIQETERECCNTYKCKPIEDACIYLHQYDVIEGIQISRELEVTEPQLYKPGEEWEDGLCEKCNCDTINGQHFPNCIKELCKDISTSSESEDYVLRELKVPGKCCPEIFRVQCKDKEGNTYEVGEQWSDVDDPCISYSCDERDMGDIQITKNKVNCMECPKNAELIPPSKILGQCCGICHITKCEENDKLYKVGDTWISDDHPCRVAECGKEFGSVKIIYTKQPCSTVPKDCPKNKIVKDENGCCEVCNATSEISCSSGPIPEENTIGFFTYHDRQHGGICTNENPVSDILQCSGACHSRSYYSLEDGDFKDTCLCCKVNITVNRTIELRCPDGNRIKKVFLQPETCQCSKCAPKDRITGATKKIDFSKNRWSQSEVQDVERFPFRQGQEHETEFEPIVQKDLFNEQQQQQDIDFSQMQQRPENDEQQHFFQQQQQDLDFSQIQQRPENDGQQHFFQQQDLDFSQMQQRPENDEQQHFFQQQQQEDLDFSHMFQRPENDEQHLYSNMYQRNQIRE